MIFNYENHSPLLTKTFIKSVRFELFFQPCQRRRQEQQFQGEDHLHANARRRLKLHRQSFSGADVLIFFSLSLMLRINKLIVCPCQAFSAHPNVSKVFRSIRPAVLQRKSLAKNPNLLIYLELRCPR